MERLGEHAQWNHVEEVIHSTESEYGYALVVLGTITGRINMSDRRNVKLRIVPPDENLRDTRVAALRIVRTVAPIVKNCAR